MLIMGLDPSTTSTGWAVLDENERIVAHGQIRPKEGKAELRILSAGTEVTRIVRTHAPHVVGIEKPDIQGIVGRTTGVHGLLSFTTAYFTGRIYSFVERIIIVPVQVWKGSVPKDVTWRRLLRKYGESLPRGTAGRPWQNDAIDAVGIADFTRKFLQDYPTNERVIFAEKR